ncbi:MAG: hypothetical protein IJD55_05345 [Clostridia bacterium]|nr:hypothetical protein [Clostridia bacterium]
MCLFSAKNQHRICMHKFSWETAHTHLQAEKRRFVFCSESSLSFCLLSDMLTIVSVIFSLCGSDIEALRLQ